VNVVLAEDEVLLREGLTGLLERFGHRVLASVGDAEALVAAVDAHRPDIVITDVRMPPSQTDEGLRAAVALRARYPGLALMALSQYVEPTYAAELLDDGGAGVGYLLKDRIGDVAEFIDALRRIAAGETVVDPEVVRQLLLDRGDPIRRLTAREREVLGLMAEGRSNAAIGRTLVVTDAAVSKHIANILAKLDLPPTPDHHRRVMAILAYLRKSG
jgi:DNA-binding NarL/FixJ family response regulator